MNICRIYLQIHTVVEKTAKEKHVLFLYFYSYTKERVTFKQKPSKNGSDCEYHGEDITPAPTLESNATLTLHYANEDS